MTGRTRAVENIDLDKVKVSTILPAKPSASKSAACRSAVPSSRTHSAIVTDSTQDNPPTKQRSYHCDDCEQLHFITLCLQYKSRTPNSRIKLIQE